MTVGPVSFLSELNIFYGEMSIRILFIFFNWSSVLIN